MPRRTLLLVALAILVAACGQSSGSEELTEIAATLEDYSIDLDKDTVSTGSITISATNEGAEVHEIEVFAGTETDLPVSQGVADTSALTLVDEIEDIVPGSVLSLEIDLPPGEYVIMCNLPDHFEKGMVATLTVTE